MIGWQLMSKIGCVYRNKKDNSITIKLWIIWTLSKFILGYLSTRLLFLKRPELSRKEIKILEFRLKTRLGVRTSSKIPKNRVQNAPKHGSEFVAQKYHLTLLECQTAL